MKTRHVYLALCFFGIVLPYSQFLPWIAENGLDIALLIEEITTSRIAAFGWLDVIVSALALFVFIFTDGRREKIANLWLPVAGTLLVGVSLGLPLFLYLREVNREQTAAAQG